MASCGNLIHSSHRDYVYPMNARHAYHIAFPGITRPIPDHAFPFYRDHLLNDGELGGRNVESIDIGGEAAERLL